MGTVSSSILVLDFSMVASRRRMVVHLEDTTSSNAGTSLRAAWGSPHLHATFGVTFLPFNLPGWLLNTSSVYFQVYFSTGSALFHFQG